MRYSKRIVLVLILLLSFSLPTLAQDDLPIIRQWVNTATATSELSSEDWSANQLIGEPDSPCGEESSSSWASVEAGTVETLTVYFEAGAYPTEINIHENFSPGNVVSISLIPSDGTPIEISNSSSSGNTGCIHTVLVQGADRDIFTIGLEIQVDQSSSGDWAEIDAIELVGRSDGQPVVDPSDVEGEYKYTGNAGVTVNCDNGVTFNNGVEVTVIQMRSGFTYTATALGINGFDPVLAVLDSKTGTGLCTDDSADAAGYSAFLPTTGQIEPATTNSQVFFANNSNEAFADIQLVVGGFNDAPGEFILILEGMASTAADGSGDPFALQITPGMIASGVQPTVYMISVVNGFDPLMALVNDDGIVTDANGDAVACDDAGNPNSCWGESTLLSDYYVSRSGDRRLAGGGLDSMLTLPIEAGLEGLYYRYLMSRTQNTTGDYIAVFHAATR